MNLFAQGAAPTRLDKPAWSIPACFGIVLLYLDRRERAWRRYDAQQSKNCHDAQREMMLMSGEMALVLAGHQRDRARWVHVLIPRWAQVRPERFADAARESLRQHIDRMRQAQEKSLGQKDEDEKDFKRLGREAAQHTGGGELGTVEETCNSSEKWPASTPAARPRTRRFPTMKIEEQVLGEMRTKYVADADWPALLELILKVLALLAPFLMKESP